MSKKATGTIDAKTLADLAGVTVRRLNQLAAEGVLPKAARGLFPTADALRALFNHFRTRTETSHNLLRDAKQRRLEARARIEEVEADEAERRVIRREDVQAYIIATFAPVRERLVSAPGALCARVNPENPAHARAILVEWSDETLRHCREHTPEKTAPDAKH